MKQLKNNRGEGQISVGAKIILAVVIGALILGGLYLLFDRVILRNTDRQIKELMAAGGSSEVLEVRTTDDRALLTSLSYTHDGVTWIPSEIPTYAKDAKVLTLASGGTADAPVTLCIIRSTTMWSLSIPTTRGEVSARESDGLLQGNTVQE